MTRVGNWPCCRPAAARRSPRRGTSLLSTRPPPTGLSTGDPTRSGWGSTRRPDPCGRAGRAGPAEPQRWQPLRVQPDPAQQAPQEPLSASLGARSGQPHSGGRRRLPARAEPTPLGACSARRRHLASLLRPGTRRLLRIGRRHRPARRLSRPLGARSSLRRPASHADQPSRGRPPSAQPAARPPRHGHRALSRLRAHLAPAAAAQDVQAPRQPGRQLVTTSDRPMSDRAGGPSARQCTRRPSVARAAARATRGQGVHRGVLDLRRPPTRSPAGSITSSTRPHWLQQDAPGRESVCIRDGPDPSEANRSTIQPPGAHIRPSTTPPLVGRHDLLAVTSHPRRAGATAGAGA